MDHSSNDKSITVKAIKEILTIEQQIELYTTLEKMFSENKISIQTKLKELNEKYNDLVWMARSSPELHAKRPDIKKIFNDTSAKYPGELEKLQKDQTNWQHGFNSGILAIVRLLSAYSLSYNHKEEVDYGEDNNIVRTRADEIEQAEEDFPMLDT